MKKITKNTFLVSITLMLFIGLLTNAQSQSGIFNSNSSEIHFEENAARKSPILTAPLIGQIDHKNSGNPKWAFKIRSLNSRKHYDAETEEIKAVKTAEKLRHEKYEMPFERNTSAVTPLIGNSFEANWMINGTPSDNAMAISNGGIIVTANNDGVAYYNTSGSLLYFDFWDDFFNDPALTSSIFDPRVYYDFVQDRFILVALHGNTAATSKLLICFSKSNNPTTVGWWYYNLPGNPLAAPNNNCWFDFPNIGISNQELFISGNLFNTGGAFNQAVVYQIVKSNGYNGAPILTNQIWSVLSNTPFTAFGLVPVSSAMGTNFSPGIYLISNKSGGDNRIRKWRISGSIISNPVMTVSTITASPYSPAGDASQLGTTALLDNGDCRIQNAFILDDKIHYVFHGDVGLGWNGIYYHRLDAVTNAIQQFALGQAGTFDLAYPAVVAYTNSVNDKSVMIALLRSGSTIFPEVRVVNCDDIGTFSTMTLVKQGETFANLLATNPSRWGDYTGISRRHAGATQGRIWLAGSYGANITFPLTVNTWKTWIAEVFSNPGPVAIEENNNTETSLSIFPNPVYDMFTLEFMLDQREEISIVLSDLNGRTIKLFYKDTPKTGLNRISFNKGDLPAATYLLTVKNNKEILWNEKIVVVN